VSEVSELCGLAACYLHFVNVCLSVIGPSTKAIHFPSGEKLGCDGSNRLTGTGQMLFQRHGRLHSRSCVCHAAEDGHNLRQTKIQNLGVTTLGDENVGWLNVPMDNISRVSGIECVRDLDAER
jgi:hypothetical protein